MKEIKVNELTDNLFETISKMKAQKALAFIAGHLNLNVFGTTRCVMAGKEPVKA